MLKHYLRIGLRNFLKHKSSSLINAFGLSLAVGCSLFVFLFIEFFLTIDEYHVNGTEIFVINQEVLVDHGTELYSGTPEPMGPLLKENSSAIIEMSRLKDGFGYVRYGDKVFEESIRFVDPGFLDMLTFPLKWGVSSSLAEPNALILSEKISQKYFGDENPVGEQLTIKFINNDVEHIEPFIIRGVAQEFNKGSSFSFRFLANYNQMEVVGFDRIHDWSKENDVTFIQLNRAENIATIMDNTSDFVALQNAANEEMQVANYQFIPFLEASRRGQEVRGNIFTSPGIEGFIVLSILSSIIMILACINYMNIAIASAVYRLKEIGIRKVMGSARKQLIYQFLSENFIICALAIGIGMIWTQIFFLPGFRAIIPNPLTLDLMDHRLWVYLGALIVLTVFGGAGYPALYISKFQPTAILKDKVKFGGKSVFRRVLLGFQYFFSFIAVIAVIILIQNDNYQRTLDWGYGKDEVIVVKVKGGAAYEKLKQEVVKIPSVRSVAGSYDQIGSSVSETTFEIGDTRFTTDEIRVGWDYLETLDVKLIDGRSFIKERTSDRIQSIIVNQHFVKERGWISPIGESIKIGEINYYVIGTIQDFHYRPFWAEIGSLMLRLSPKEDYRYLSVKVTPGELITTGTQIESGWHAVFPDDPYDYFYQNRAFDNEFRQLDMVTGVISTAGIIAILLAVIGLFGLSALRIKSRMREISIRKVLGGSWMHLGIILNKEFMVLLVIASVLAVPVGYYAVVALLSTVTKYPVPISALPFISTILLLTALSIAAVGGHVLKAVRTNPSDILRAE